MRPLDRVMRTRRALAATIATRAALGAVATVLLTAAFLTAALRVFAAFVRICTHDAGVLQAVYRLNLRRLFQVPKPCGQLEASIRF